MYRTIFKSIDHPELVDQQNIEFLSYLVRKKNLPGLTQFVSGSIATIYHYLGNHRDCRRYLALNINIAVKTGMILPLVASILRLEQEATEVIDSICPELTEKLARLTEMARDGWKKVLLFQGISPDHKNLTDRDYDILLMLHQSLSNKEIARKLNITVSAVNKHLARIYDEMGVRNRKEASAILIQSMKRYGAYKI